MHFFVFDRDGLWAGGDARLLGRLGDWSVWVLETG